MKKIKLLYLVPHLSTGGMPQFVLKRIESLQNFKDTIEIFLVEYSLFSDTYVVQRNKIIDLLDTGHFFTLGYTTDSERKKELIKIIKELNIDIVHSEEIPEAFESFNRIPIDILNDLYDNSRSWKIVETCHNIWYNANQSKKLHPDHYLFVTPYHEKFLFNETPTPQKLLMYPYENKVNPILNELGLNYTEHRVPTLRKYTTMEKLGMDTSKIQILNVGLWTEGKNQKEGIEIARLLEHTHPEIHFNFVGNQSPNFESYWGPLMSNLPSNVTIWGERDDVNLFMESCDVLMFNSTWECNPLVLRESINYGLKILSRNLPQYMGMFNGYITQIDDNETYQNISEKLLNLINSKDCYTIVEDLNFSNELLLFYFDVLKTPKQNNNRIENNLTINQHFVVNPFLEILGESDDIFNVKFFDNENLIYENNIKSNSWVKLNREYYTDWYIEVSKNGNIFYKNKIDLKNKRVYISFWSKSLGDTIAWMSYCEEFRLKHGCELIVSTFRNYLFIDQYPNIQFVDPGESVSNIYAQYRLGWFYNEGDNYNPNIHKYDMKKQPLQKTATDILGLEYKEIKPKLKLPNVTKDKKVGIGFHSTAQAKYWNNPDDWQKVINYLNNLGYECMIYSKEGDGYMNNYYPDGVTIFKGGNLQEVIDDLSTCEFFIGLGSGLSWLAWACELPIILISGFSQKWTETKLNTYRVINENVCHGCFNSEKLNANDWNWCPLHKNTDRMFECTKNIDSEMVINEINKIIEKNNNDDEVTIILSHPNTDEKLKVLIENLKSIKTKKILSINYPIESYINEYCDHIVLDSENPILLQKEFDEYNSKYYWVTYENGEETKTYFDYEHGYAVYKLIYNGLNEAKKIGYKKCNIVNYDYIINEQILNNNTKLLDEYDGIFYKYKNKPYDNESYSTGFFSGKIDKLIEVFSNYTSKKEYYNHKNSYNILEVITYDLIKEKKLNVKELYYEDLKYNCVLDSITDTHKLKKFNKKLSEFNWGKKSEWYVSQAIQEIFENNTYERFFEVEENDIVVDLGASLGPFTFKILSKNPKFCYVVEPLSYQIKVLKENVGYHNVKIIQGAITDKKKIEISWDGITEIVPTFTFKEFLNENNISKIDFLKCDCEGGEYDVFQPINIEFLKTIPKIVVEFHLRDDENFNKCKFRWFRDNIISQFKNYEVYSVDGVNIKWDLFNEHFIEYYNEVIVYFNNY